jgi:hypothetical protein
MKIPHEPFDEGEAFHFLIGEPDESCEICRAVGLAGHGVPPPTDGGEDVAALLAELLSCPCPLCRTGPAASRRRPRGRRA